MTVTICIGNSDDKLTQKEWAHFVEAMDLEIGCVADKWYFRGGPETRNIRQNYAWIVNCQPEKLDKLREVVTNTRMDFKQDSAAFVVGETELI